MEIASRNSKQIPSESRKNRTLYTYETAFAGKKDSRTISSLDAKLAAMQNLLYGVSRTKRNASKWN